SERPRKALVCSRNARQKRFIVGNQVASEFYPSLLLIFSHSRHVVASCWVSDPQNCFYVASLLIWIKRASNCGAKQGNGLVVSHVGILLDAMRRKIKKPTVVSRGLRTSSKFLTIDVASGYGKRLC